MIDIASPASRGTSRAPQMGVAAGGGGSSIAHAILPALRKNQGLERECCNPLNFIGRKFRIFGELGQLLIVVFYCVAD
jgi:hypothetical protein